MVYSLFKTFLWVAALSLLLYSGSLYPQEIRFESDDLRSNILQVADNYARNGDFKAAILQYYEYLYRFPDDSLLPQIALRLATVYQETGNFTVAERHLKEAITKYSHTKYDLENRLRLAVLYYENGNYEAAIEYALPQPEEPFRLLELYCWIQLDETGIADTLADQIRQGKYCPEIISEYFNLRNSDVAFDWKKKWGAYTMSALLPGSGRILIGEYKDGILTVLGFGGLIKVTLYTLQNHPAFYYYAATGTLIYYGLNMYSTHFAIERYRDRVMQSNLRRLLRIYPLSEQLRLAQPY